MNPDPNELGLTSTEVHVRQQRDGLNDPAPGRRAAGLWQLLALFASPLTIVLIVAATVSAALGEIASSLIIIAVVLIGSGIDFYQTFRSQRAVQRLREGVALTATAKRDGQWLEVPRRELVAGDLIRLSAGDLVPADARLLEARDLHVQ